MNETEINTSAEPDQVLPDKKRSPGIVVEIVVNLTVLMIASIILISVVLIWTQGVQENIEGLHTPYILLPYIFLFGIVIAIFGTMLIRRLIMDPLRQLLEATEKVAEGDLDYRVPVEDDNEMAQLAQAFNRMTERLKQSKTEVNEHVENLESLNRELKQTQDQLIFSEKLASVGRLAAGVAHEIGNPLSTILGYLEIIGRSKQLSEREQDMLARIEHELNRINHTIRELLDFSRPGDQEREILDINQLIRLTSSLTAAHRGSKDIETEIELAADVPPVWGNRNKLEQLLVNLMLNALDAMPEGGRLTIQSIGDSLNNGMVEIQVRDTGTGIEPEIIDKIFDPFFTTKEPGKGVGLGLSICFNIAKSLNGKIEVESRLDRGSTFQVTLPVADTGDARDLKEQENNSE